MRVQVGDRVIFAKNKMSPSPGKRAQDVAPTPKGDDYSYIVEKYWTVLQVHEDSTATLLTRRGKKHRVALNDPLLRRANLWERFFLRKRFPKLPESPADR